MNPHLLSEGCASSTDANEPASWASDWTADQSFQQSESTWIAFSQETVEQKIVPGGQWWPSTETPNLSLSPLHNVVKIYIFIYVVKSYNNSVFRLFKTLRHFFLKTRQGNVAVV